MSVVSCFGDIEQRKRLITEHVICKVALMQFHSCGMHMAPQHCLSALVEFNSLTSAIQALLRAQ
jgi:hypothetical protein